MSKLLAIVPAYNESGAIAATVTDVLDNAPGFDVVVVNDGSTDDTAAIARQAGAAVIHHPFNIGIGGAVQSGYQYALDHDYDVAVQVDGDGQHDARYIPELLAMLRSDPRLNMVSGSRFIGDGEAGYQSSATRRVGIRFFSGILSRLTGRAVTDPTSGFRMTDRLGIELFARDYPHDYAFPGRRARRVPKSMAPCRKANGWPVSASMNAPRSCGAMPACDQRAAIDAAVLRLAGGGHGSGATDMARLFKALAVTKPGLGVPPGFETASP